MSSEPITLEHLEEPAADLPAPRSLAAIREDLEVLEARRLTPGTEMTAARDRIRRQLSGVSPGGDAWRAVLDEHLPALDRLEGETVSHLEGIRARVLADREALARLPYRPGLPAAQATAAETKAAQLRGRLATMGAAAVARALHAALIFADPVDMAAWALCGEEIVSRFPPDRNVPDETGRPVPPRQLLADPLRQCERATGHRATLETRDRLETALLRLNGAISEITAARNAHDPSGNVGSLLARYQFGRRDGAAAVASERRYSPEAVSRRLGVAS